MTPRRLALVPLEDRALPAPLFGSALTYDSADFARADDVATDAAGNVYLAGTFSGTIDADPGAGTVPLDSDAAGNGLVAAYTPAGALVWALQFGAGGGIIDQHITRDAAGNIYLAGLFGGDADFNPGPGVFRMNAPTPGFPSAFVLALTPAGDFRWARQIDPAGTIEVGDVVAVPGGLVVVGSFAGSADFNPEGGTTTLTAAGSFDAYALKLTAAGALTWARAWGGTTPDAAFAVAADAGGSVYATGRFSGTADLDPGAAAAAFTARGDHAAFLVKLDPAGTLAWARAWDGGGSDIGLAVAVTPAGDLYAGGSFQGTVDFDPGPAAVALKASAGLQGLYLTRLTAAGQVVWARGLTGSGFATVTGLAADAGGQAYLTGYFAGPALDLDPGPGRDRTAIPGDDIYGFVARYDPAGRHVWGEVYAGTEVFPAAVAVAPGGDVYTAGSFNGTVDLDPGPGTVARTSPGEFTPTLFLAKLTQPTGPLTYTAPAGNGPDDLVLRRKGGTVEVYDARTRRVVAGKPFDELSAVTITGAADEDDRLTVDYAGGGFYPTTGITFAGGAGGMDTLRVKGADADYVLTAAGLTSTAGPGMTLSGLERAELTGGSGANVLNAAGFAGSVVLSGGGGDDELYGAAGPSTLLGGGGRDILVPGAGPAVVNGGGGVDLLGATADADMALGVREGQATGLRITAAGLPAVFHALSGVETAALSGGAGANVLDTTLFNGSVTLTGGGGNDRLTGGRKADLLIGGAGADTLAGGSGNDVLLGEAGADTFGQAEFDAGEVQDFVGGEDVLV